MPEGTDIPTPRDGDDALDWRLSDGRGALSSGTPSGASAHRGQVLLAVPSGTPVPTALLARLDDRVQSGGVTSSLTPVWIAGPHGPALRAPAPATCESFEPAPWPRWRFRGEGWCVEREYRLVPGHGALVATWRLVEGGPVQLQVAPLLVSRALDALQVTGDEFRGALRVVPGRVTLGLPGRTLTLWHGGTFLPARAWQRALVHAQEPNVSEDAFVPGWVHARLASRGEALHLVAALDESLFRALAVEGRLGEPPARSLSACVAALDAAVTDSVSARDAVVHAAAARTHRQALAAHAAHGAVPPPADDDRFASDLGPRAARLAAPLLASLRERADRLAVITHPETGEEDGADALRVGAALVTIGEYGPARAIARGYLAYLDEGLAPTSFAADGTPRHDGPEPSLWLVHLVDLLARRDPGPTQEMLSDGGWRALDSVVQHLRSGSRRGIRCDRDGFLWSGEGLAARCDADVNALWYHALVGLSQIAKLAGRRENAAFHVAWARELQRLYVDRFWDEAAGALHERLEHTGPRAGLDAGQLYAVALPPLLLPGPLAVRLVDTLTARGVASDQEWLGTWASAMLRAHGRDPATSARVRAALAAAEAPRGVREAADRLRAWVEEVDHRIAREGAVLV